MSTTPKTPLDFLKEKFPEELLKEGYTCIPNEVIDRFRRAGMTPTELVLWLIIIKFQFKKELPHPSILAIADRLGKSIRTVERYIKRLEEKDLLKVHRQEGENNRYDFKPFYDKVIALYAGVPITLPGSQPRSSTSSTQSTKPPEAEPEPEPPAEPEPAELPAEPPAELPAETDSMPTRYIESLIEDISKEFGDADSIKSNVTRALKAFAKVWPLGMDEYVFSELIYESRSKAKMTAINKRNSHGQVNRMPWFFTDLEREVLRTVKELNKQAEVAARMMAEVAR